MAFVSAKIKKKKNIFSVFSAQFIRIGEIISWSAIFFVGFVLGMSSLDFHNYIIPLSVFLISAFFITSFTFAINNYYDIESDEKNPRRMNVNSTSSGRITKKTSIVFITTFFIIPLVITILFKIEVFILCASILFLGLGYSVPPLRFKGRPGIDIIWHFVGFLICVIFGSLISGSVTPLVWLVAISLGIFSCIGQIWNHIIDYSFDRTSHTTTFAVKFGLRKSEKILRLFIGLHIVFLIALILLYCVNYFETVISLVGLLVLGLIVIRPKRNAFPKRDSYHYYLAVGLGGAVYTSCIIYHLLLISGKPVIFEFLDFIQIF